MNSPLIRSLGSVLPALLLCLVGCGTSPPEPPAGDGSEDPSLWQQYLSAPPRRMSDPEPAAPAPADSEAASAEAAGTVYPAGYVGTSACAECHRDQYESYRRTAHSRSSRRAKESAHQEPASFRHAATDRRYEILPEDDRMVHREIIRGSDGETIAVNEAAIAHEIGSGTHAHSYLFRSSKFHVQSPVTWYSDGGQWDLSPGFDPSERATFARAVTTTCVFCHIGSIRVTDQNPHHFSILQQTIGCERCHGPGEGHVRRQRAAAAGGESAPDTGPASEMPPDRIVHPGLLDRERAGDLCAQCHLQGDVFSGPSDQNSWDFRPGQRLSRYRTDYKVEGRGEEFRIVGHTEQLHDSACYQQTDRLTCTTCHDPHPPANVNSVDNQRRNCLKCHEDSSCGVPAAKRHTANQNDCAACHMPARPTNVAHAALHHHRIDVHPESYAAASMQPPAESAEQHEADRGEGAAATDVRLRPIVPDDSLPQWQQKRRWALAMHSLMLHHGNMQGLEEAMASAQRTLLELHRQGRDDPSVQSVLALDYLRAGDRATAAKLARRVLRQVPQTSGSGIGATDVLSQVALARRDNAAARARFAELTRSRFVIADHYMLGLCERNAGNTEAAVAALERALTLDPTLVAAHQLLAAILESAGHAERAAAHRQAIEAIRAAGDRVPGNAPSE